MAGLTDDQADFNPFIRPPYPGWAPYCLRCPTFDRMKVTAFGWQCVACSNPIDKLGHHWNGPV